MKITDEQFKKIMQKIDRTPSLISDDEFSALLSKTKTYRKGTKNSNLYFAPIKFGTRIKKTELPKIKKVSKEKIGLYKKVVDLYEKIIDTNEQPRTIIQKITEEKKDVILSKKVEELEKLLLEMQKKVIVYEQYNAQGNGGSGVVFHDTTLSGTGVPGDPLKVVSQGGGGGYTYNEGGVFNGSTNTITLLHVPTAPTVMLVSVGGTNLSQIVAIGDFSITGAVITLAVTPPNNTVWQVFYS